MTGRALFGSAPPLDRLRLPPWLDTRARALVSRALDALSAPASSVSRRAAWTVFGAFALQVVVLTWRHEPWFDEAQAWLLARDASLPELLTRLLRYEGSPPLWHLLLMGPAKLGLPYRTISAIGAACALGGGALVAFRSPFPLLVRVGLLFSWAIGYQYAAVARNYTLMPLAMFAVAIVWPQRGQRPRRLALALGFLSLVTLHGFLIAGSLAAVHGISMLRRWSTLDALTRRRQLVAGGGLLALGLLLVAILFPPSDLANAAGRGLNPLHFAVAAPLVLNSTLTGNLLASGIAVVASGLWLWRTRTLAVWIVPTLALLALSTLRYHSPWHDGIPFLVWVMALWISLERPADQNRKLALRRLAVVALIGVLVVHVAWWAQSAAYDVRRPYSASPALAEYLQNLEPDASVYATSFHALGALAYLDDNRYDNMRDGEMPAYYSWSTTPIYSDRWIDVYLADPDVIIWGVKFAWQGVIPHFPGYQRVAVLEGALFWKNRIYEQDAFIVYERRV